MPAIIQEIQSASPEAKRAQRMAELEQMSAYRSKRIKEYQEWSDPIKRAERQALAEKEAQAARKMVSEKPKEFAFDFDSHDIRALGAVKAKTIPIPLKWHARFFNWLTKKFK